MSERQAKSHNSRHKRSQASSCRQTEADCFAGCALTERLISRERQSGLFEASHKQSSEREYIRPCEVFFFYFPTLLSCIPLLSDKQTRLVDRNNSTITWRTKYFTYVMPRLFVWLKRFGNEIPAYYAVYPACYLKQSTLLVCYAAVWAWKKSAKLENTMCTINEFN